MKIQNQSVYLLLGLLQAAAVSGCAPQDKWSYFDSVSSYETIQKRGDMMALPASSIKLSMLDIGRAMSKGTVDIYDPYLISLDATEALHSPIAKNISFPMNRNIYVRDKNITVYSLSSNAALDNTHFNAVLDNVYNEQVAAEPIPLMESKELQ